MMLLTDDTAAKMKTMDAFETVEKMLETAGKGEPQIYPQNPNSNWNVDYFGPIYLPKRGDKVKIDSSNYLLYAPAIRDYEGNSDVSWNSAEKKISVNGQLSDTYEFKMNYYFMMGDNRHNSLDSRYWGMVPEDHIVGTPIFIWLSTNDQAKGWGDWIRWDKSFRFVK
jgi:signal peptidase I